MFQIKHHEMYRNSLIELDYSVALVCNINQFVVKRSAFIYIRFLDEYE